MEPATSLRLEMALRKKLQFFEMVYKEKHGSLPYILIKCRAPSARPSIDNLPFDHFGSSGGGGGLPPAHVLLNIIGMIGRTT